MADNTVWRACGCRNPKTGKKWPKDQCPKFKADSKHGSWRYRISTKDPRTGKRVQELKAGFTTKKAAQTARNERMGHLDTGTYRRRVKLTTADYLTSWIDQKELLGDLRASSLRMYRRYVENDLIPALGNIQLSDLHEEDVQRLITDLLKAGRGAVTVRRIHATLRSALSDAVKIRTVGRNVARDVELPKHQRPKVHPWEPSEAQTFLAAASRDRLGAMFELAMAAGLRRGELIGLKWSDVDVDRRVLTVHRQITSVGGKRVEGTVKTSSGEARRIALSAEVAGSLIAHRLDQEAERAAWGEAYVDNDRVFCKENGQDLSPDYVGRLFQKLVKAAGVRPIRLHDLRHGAASLMLAAGTDIAIVSKLLGHSTVSITSDTYSHLIGDAGQRAAAGVAALLYGADGAHQVHTKR